jgi:hypothetical protein
MFTDLATSAYALSILGLRSANGTSTVILTRVGLNCSTLLGTLVTPVIAPRDGMRTARGWLTLSRGNPTGRPQPGQTSAWRVPTSRLACTLACPTLVANVRSLPDAGA